ncbi:MAG: RnfH family protein [Gammaproteobacteria bacterium]|nr:RnfH family protein [Gammaproteobacteria bacterium]
MSLINVEVVYARSSQQWLIPLQVPVGTTAIEAIRLSKIIELCPKIDLSHLKIGLFSKPITLDTVLHHQDRVEIYRPLLIDPMQKRIIRAKKHSL